MRPLPINASLALALLFALSPSLFGWQEAEKDPVNQKQLELEDELSFGSVAAPLFQKYCNSCHNNDDRDGGLSLVSPDEIAKGGENGAALLAGNAGASRLFQMITGELEPRMPPDDLPGPTKDEINLLRTWIDEGAKVGKHSLLPKELVVPAAKSKVNKDPITDLAWSSDGKWIAVARYQRIEIIDGSTRKPVFELTEHPGKVNSVRFSNDSRYLLAASGVTGLRGVAVEWDLDERKVHRKYEGHRDVIYAAEYSPDSKTIATAGYDKKILVWERESKNRSAAPSELLGHNDAVYGLKFSPDGTVLASASGDQTIKLWNVKTGLRLDTLGQPLKEQFVTTFHPDGDWVLGAGRDNRIRAWNWLSKTKPKSNPIEISRFAHEASIVALDFTKDGSLLVTSAEDKTVKIWSGSGIELIKTLPTQSDVVFGMSISPENLLAVGRLDGTIDYYPLPKRGSANRNRVAEIDVTSDWRPNATLGYPENSIRELEPNSRLDSSQMLELPAVIQGRVYSEGEATDVDLFRFQAKKGQQWVIETNAARSKSPLDTKIEVLNSDGSPIPRVRLQALRDSYFTFRGKDANTSDDFRVHNWEEMELNELMYCNGELVRLFLYPRGPDSGFKVYPGFGNRHNFLDTTPVAHALQEPCYIVKAFPPGAEVAPNGLPVFDLFYENDDEAQRKLGTDSKLCFTAPADGEYLVRVTDSRGNQGKNHRYQLHIRSPKPDFKVSFSGRKLKLKRGSGREFELSANRIDNFNGPIEIYFDNVPAGIVMPEKLTIQRNHYKAFGTIHAATGAKQPDAQQLERIQITAVGTVNGKKVKKDLGRIEELKLEDAPKIQTRIIDTQKQLTEEAKKQLFTDQRIGTMTPIELTIRPGTTISANLVVHRLGHKGDIDFGNAESGRNLPHGVFVDNIGLNGLRIIKGQGDVREIFITAAKWVPEQDRLFHLKANNVEGETTLPVLLRVRR